MEASFGFGFFSAGKWQQGSLVLQIPDPGEEERTMQTPGPTQTWGKRRGY